MYRNMLSVRNKEVFFSLNPPSNERDAFLGKA